MRDYGRTKNDHAEKAAKAHSSGLIEKNIFTVNSLNRFTVIYKISNQETFPISEMSTFDDVKELFFFKSATV